MNGTLMKQQNMTDSADGRQALMLAVDSDTKVTYASESAGEILDVLPDTLIGSDIRDLLHSESCDETAAERCATVSAGDPWQGDVCFKGPGGKPIWMDTSVVVSHADGGELSTLDWISHSFSLFRQDTDGSSTGLCRGVYERLSAEGAAADLP